MPSISEMNMFNPAQVTNNQFLVRVSINSAIKRIDIISTSSRGTTTINWNYRNNNDLGYFIDHNAFVAIKLNMSAEMIYSPLISMHMICSYDNTDIINEINKIAYYDQMFDSFKTYGNDIMNYHHSRNSSRCNII